MPLPGQNRIFNLLGVASTASWQDARQRAGRGARCLDRLYPLWHQRLRLDQFSFERRGQCLLGQLFGSRLRGYLWLLLAPGTGPRADLDALGFSCRLFRCPALRQQDAAFLAQAWHIEVEARRAPWQARPLAPLVERPLCIN